MAEVLEDIITTTTAAADEAIQAAADAQTFEDASLVSQIFSGVFFAGLSLYLIFANGTKLSFIHRASLEKRLTVCCFINTYVGVFSAFFNFFQITEVDNIPIPRDSQFVLDFARPVEWILTCPLMQLVLVLLGGSRIPEIRRTIMPMLSMIILVWGTASMLLDSALRFACFFCGFSTALLMWGLNAKQINEHSNGEESIFAGDSEFRKATLLLIATWFPFPCWFIISPEGLGIVQSILLIQVGWAFLNIVSKFTFIFYIQRIKDNYCSRLKVKREMYAGPPNTGNMMMQGGDGMMKPGQNPHDSDDMRSNGELHGIVVETMTFLGMVQHADRFMRLLHNAEVRSPEMVDALSKERCAELQLPWDLVCALQKRIQVWHLEMRDTAEIELEKGEQHYERHFFDNRADAMMGGMSMDPMMGMGGGMGGGMGMAVLPGMAADPFKALPPAPMQEMAAPRQVGVEDAASKAMAMQMAEQTAEMSEKMSSKMEKMEAMMEKMAQRQEANQQNQMQALHEMSQTMASQVNGIVQQSICSNFHESLRAYLPNFEADAFGAIERATLTATESIRSKAYQGQTDIVSRMDDLQSRMIKSTNRADARIEELIFHMKYILEGALDRQFEERKQKDAEQLKMFKELFADSAHENGNKFDNFLSEVQTAFKSMSSRHEGITEALNKLEYIVSKHLSLQLSDALKKALAGEVEKLVNKTDELHRGLKDLDQSIHSTTEQTKQITELKHAISDDIGKLLHSVNETAQIQRESAMESTRR
eukprot:TRINITY_DN1576_c0_g1_i5.p1 TRINITY_DN1576_c0_g1~~TRINITY_DN1576_c0_g1_i5.p1  ORF type:complete len:763 (+),score=260.78 TRINITY_DN1576_c0_g1_i5:236-2524(+)